MSSPLSSFSHVTGEGQPTTGPARKDYLLKRIEWLYNYTIENGGTRYDAHNVAFQSQEYREYLWMKGKIYARNW